MLVLVAYDVCTTEKNGARTLRKIAKTCENYGQRVQFSLFECTVAPDQWLKLKIKLEELINPEKDSLRYYFMGSKYQSKVVQVGRVKSYSLDNPLIF